MCQVNKDFRVLFTPYLYDSVTINLNGERSRIPVIETLKSNSKHIHHLTFHFPTALKYLTNLVCPNLVSLHCRGWRGVRLQHDTADKNRAQLLLDRLIRNSSQTLRTIEFDNLWPVRKDGIWNTIAALPLLRDLLVVCPTVQEEELTGDAFWRACANTKTLRLEQVVCKVSRGRALMPRDAQLDMDADVLANGNRGEEEEEEAILSRPTTRATKTAAGGRPFSFSRVQHLELIVPFYYGLEPQDQLSLIRYCHNIKSLHWSNVPDSFQADVGENEHIQAPHSDAPQEPFIWKDLESLQLGGTGAIDENLATMIQWVFRLSVLAVPNTRFGPIALASLRSHYATIQELDWHGCELASGSMTQTILASCPSLKSFKAQELLIEYGIDEPWKCFELKTFEVDDVKARSDLENKAPLDEAAKKKVVAKIHQLQQLQDKCRIPLLEQINKLPY
ncbi:hypothetical protein BGX29_000473 [Mortierella sp. GBA35]|nr:hypothetical protein BGX29_000473 [Mortierella sp. GBA35]